MPNSSQQFKSVRKRFWAKIDRTQGPDGCWPYTEALRDGYGAFWVNGKTENAHRIAWQISKGPIPRGLHCLHRCDHKWCCNPRHLWLGTNDDNIADKVAKGRQARGEKHSEIRRKTALRGEAHPHSRLSNADVLAIRKMRKMGGTLKGIGAFFKVSYQTVRNVAIGRSWAHIT